MSGAKGARTLPIGPRGRGIAAAVALLAAAILPYIGSWNGGFLWDDNTILVDSELVADPSGWWKIWVAPPPSHPDYFPLTTFSFWLEWRIWGDSPAGYRIINTLLHATSVLLLWRLLLAMAVPGAWLAALLFAVHPVNAESVAWISERKNLLAMVFAIPAFFWFIRWDSSRKPAHYIASLLLFILAAAAKASVVTLPLVFASWVAWRRGPSSLRGMLLPLAPYVAVSLAFGLAVLHFQHTRAIADWEITMPSATGRFGQACLAFWFYLGKAILPVGLATIYPPWSINPESTAILCFAVLTAAALGWLWFSGGFRLRGLAFGLTSSLLLLLPTLGLLKMSFLKYAPVSDHFQHLALPAIIATLVGGASTCLASFPARRAVAILAAVALTASLGWATMNRAALHASHEALWRDALAKNPSSTQPHTVLASILQKSGRTTEASGHFKRAASLAPDDPLVLTNLGLFLLETGDPANAIAPLRKAIETGQKYPEAHINLSRALLLQGNLEEALQVLRAGADMFPEDISLNSAAGASLLLANRNNEALVYLTRCEALMPENTGFKIDVANALKRLGRIDEANAKLREAAK